MLSNKKKQFDELVHLKRHLNQQCELHQWIFHTNIFQIFQKRSNKKTIETTNNDTFGNIFQ